MTNLDQSVRIRREEEAVDDMYALELAKLIAYCFQWRPMATLAEVIEQCYLNYEIGCGRWIWQSVIHAVAKYNADPTYIENLIEHSDASTDERVNVAIAKARDAWLAAGYDRIIINPTTQHLDALAKLEDEYFGELIKEANERRRKNADMRKKLGLDSLFDK